MTPQAEHASHDLPVLPLRDVVALEAVAQVAARLKRSAYLRTVAPVPVLGGDGVSVETDRDLLRLHLVAN